MATVTYFTDGNYAPTGTNDGDYFAAQYQIDFSEKNVSASDVVQCVNIAAGTLVQNVYVRIDTAEGSTATATVGDGAGANSWDASTNLNATAGTVTCGVSGVDAYVDNLNSATNEGKLYTSDDTIDIVPSANLDTAMITVIVRGFRITEAT